MDVVREKIESKYIIEGYIVSLIGGRIENQDSMGYSETPYGLLVTVCDGMGGSKGGKTASLIAVNTIIKYVHEADGTETQKEKVINSIKKANYEIIKYSSDHPNVKGMGTTVTVILIDGNSAIIAHVGDSRIYQFRNHKKVFRTFDHSMVFDLVKNKVITEEQARLSVQSNVITRALGIKNEIDVECVERSYDKGDRFALSTDGLHAAVPEKQLIKSLTENNNVNNVVSNITGNIDNIGKSSGGHHDNLTLALFTVNSNSKYRNKMEKKLRVTLFASIVLLLISFILNIIFLISEPKIKINDTVFNIIDSCSSENEDNNLFIIDKKDKEYIVIQKTDSISNEVGKNSDNKNLTSEN